ncbi:hypothetical protein HanXRQr2_Chr09g0399841 [Helianthus annuus]|uniref:Uncharacterized protein n=1 Tax=Helianthus annuus TaxID=4232 RepID=A0A9K3I8N7_HELAN|nr:hypothetical protein HanXRQr2_Chr09g0399841 [Helianthus annuus]KAJ0894125.1 hypothetical protein HanPSC8_Chr09g0385591 [Helianthus annuus]
MLYTNSESYTNSECLQRADSQTHKLGRFTTCGILIAYDKAYFFKDC